MHHIQAITFGTEAPAVSLATDIEPNVCATAFKSLKCAESTQCSRVIIYVYNTHTKRIEGHFYCYIYTESQWRACGSCSTLSIYAQAKKEKDSSRIKLKGKESRSCAAANK